MAKRYNVYLESGPRMKTTMVHVLDLLGCIARGPTSEQALDAAPDGIRAYQQFLARHGETVQLDDPIELFLVEHVMEGPWIGYGNPAPGFAPDFETLSLKDQKVYLARLGWLLEEILARVQGLPEEEWSRKPATGGRPYVQIIAHLAESQAIYLRYLVGKLDGLSEAIKMIQPDQSSTLAALRQIWQISLDRMSVLSEVERSMEVPHGQVIWTARRAFRRMLEHVWEHLLEIKARQE